MEINDAVRVCGEIGIEKGWLPNDLRPLEQHALIATEICEATEVIRNGGPEAKEAEELGDVILRIMTYFYQRGWDMEKVLVDKMAYNKTRDFRHGKRC